MRENINNFKEFSDKIKIEIIREIDNESCVDVLFSNFKNLVSSKDELFKKIQPRLNNGLSICLKKDEFVIGVYLLNNKSINSFITDIRRDIVSDFPSNTTKITLYEDLSDNGLQGIALSVLLEYRGNGYGEMLKKYTYKLGYDYIWGVQDKKLKNIEKWTRTRKIFAESPNRYATYIKLT